MLNVKRLLLTAAAVVAALALAAPAASAGIESGYPDGEPYSGPISGSGWVSMYNSYPYFAGSAQVTVTGEITDSAWPASGTLDLEFSNCTSIALACAIETVDGPYAFEITPDSASAGTLSIPGPVTMSVNGATGDFNVRATDMELSFTEGVPATVGIVNGDLDTELYSQWWALGSQWSIDAALDQPAGGLFIEL